MLWSLEVTANLAWGWHRVGVIEELPGVTLESSQTWTRGDTQGGGEWCARQGEQYVKKHRVEKGRGRRLDPSLAGTRLGLDPKAVEAMESPEQKQGTEGTRGDLGAS